MVYQGRVVFGGVLGLTNPFVGFGLSSRSDPNRDLEIYKNTIRVVPTLEGELQNQEKLDIAKARSNMYPAIAGFHDNAGNPVMVCTNGTMTKRVQGLIKQGMPPEHALVTTFQSYDAKEGDPRLGMIVKDCNSFWTAVHDTTEGFYFDVRRANIAIGAMYSLSSTECIEMERKPLKAGRPTMKINDSDIESLAKNAFFELFPDEDGIRTIATAVMVLKDGKEFVPFVYHPEK